MKANDNNPVLVLGLYLPGIDIIKHFAKNKVKCIGLDFRSESPGYWLRGQKAFRCPDPDENEKEFINYIISIYKRWNKRAVILITSDCFIEAILKNKDLLKKYFYFNTSKNHITETLMSKAGLYAVAKKTDIPVPKIISPRSTNELISEISKISFPCVIKPKFAPNWRKKPLEEMVDGKKVVFIKTEAELISEWEKIFKYDKEIIIQEVVQGPDENLLYFVCYIDINGDCLGYFCGRKLRITPIHFGSASFMRTTNPGPVKDYCINLLSKNGYHGPAGVEMKKDINNGNYKLIEVNTRIGLWDIIGKKIGVDIFSIAYNELVGKSQKPVKPQKNRIYWVSITSDIPTFLEYYREGSISFFKWLKTYFNNIYFSDIYLDEPKLMYHLFLKRIIKKISYILVSQK